MQRTGAPNAAFPTVIQFPPFEIVPFELRVQSWEASSAHAATVTSDEDLAFWLVTHSCFDPGSRSWEAVLLPFVAASAVVSVELSLPHVAIDREAPDSAAVTVPIQRVESGRIVERREAQY